MAIRIFVDRIFKQNQPIIFGDGMQTRDFTYVLDVVETNMLAMKKNNVNGGIFNIGSGRNISVNDLVKKILTLTSSPIKPIYDSAQLGDVEHTLADITQAKEIMDWEPKVSLEKGLREFIDWYVLNNSRLNELHI